MTDEQLKITQCYDRHGAFLVFLCWVYFGSIMALVELGYIGAWGKLFFYFGVPVLTLSWYAWCEWPSKESRQRINEIMARQKLIDLEKRRTCL